MKLTKLQEAAVDTAIDESKAIQRGIEEGGEIKANEKQYDLMSPRLSTAKWWLERLLADSKEV